MIVGSLDAMKEPAELGEYVLAFPDGRETIVRKVFLLFFSRSNNYYSQ